MRCAWLTVLLFHSVESGRHVNAFRLSTEGQTGGAKRVAQQSYQPGLGLETKCECRGLSIESQIARMIEMSYFPDGPNQKGSANSFQISLKNAENLQGKSDIYLKVRNVAGDELMRTAPGCRNGESPCPMVGTEIIQGNASKLIFKLKHKNPWYKQALYGSATIGIVERTFSEEEMSRHHLPVELDFGPNFGKLSLDMDFTAGFQDGALNDCYTWTDLTYNVPSTGFGRLLSLTAWGTPRVFVGHCNNPTQKGQPVCSVTFAGATSLAAVSGISDFGPTRLHRNASGLIDDSTTAGTSHKFHETYWKMYKALREQIGHSLSESVADCTEIYANGHSIGSALAGIWQWELADERIQQITMGQNPSYFDQPPDVKCKGRRIYQESDPVPFMRQFADADGAVIRHALVPAQQLVVRDGKWVAEELSSCDADVPFDQASAGAGTWTWHYNSAIAKGLGHHQGSAYVKAVDEAFPGVAS